MYNLIYVLHAYTCLFFVYRNVKVAYNGECMQTTVPTTTHKHHD